MEVVLVITGSSDVTVEYIIKKFKRKQDFTD